MDPVISAALQTLASNLSKFLNKQAKYVAEFSLQFEQGVRGLELMKAYVRAGARLKATNEIDKLILIQMKELICDVEDVLIDCFIRSEYQKDWFWQGRLSFDGPCFMYKTGRKLKDINSNMQQILESWKNFSSGRQECIGGSSNAKEAQHWDSKGYTPPNFNTTKPIGLDKDIRMIKGWIFDSKNRLEKIAIVGMGGLGKTTIAGEIYNDDEVISHFGAIIWVCASRSYTPDDLTRCILKNLGKREASESDATQLLKKLQEALEAKTCLVVMDDVWEIHTRWWDEVCTVLERLEGRSSSVIVTTRKEDVATKMGARIHKPKMLNPNDSWSLFSRHAFNSKGGTVSDSDFKHLGRKIVEKCGGLPLAIKTIGALLAQKMDSPSHWQQILDGFHGMTDENDVNDCLMDSLQMSYDDLPAHLRQCLLCFSIYPPNEEIQVSQLIHWWIAEGMVEGDDSKSVAEIGAGYLSVLVRRCLVEVVVQRDYDGAVHECKIHDMVRELIIKNAEEEAFCSFDDSGRQTVKPEFKTRWLSYTEEGHHTEEGHQTLSKAFSEKTAKLRALYLMPGPHFPLKHLGALKSLRMLVFTKNLTENEVKDFFYWVNSLKRLACLNLTKVQGLKFVPSSIRKLRNLQMLVLIGCTDLKKLHPSVATLKRLIALDLGSCTNLEYLPRGLGKLSHLQELTGFKVTSQSKRQCLQLHEVGKLTELRVLRIIINDDTEMSVAEKGFLLKLEKLKVLAIDTENCERNRAQILEMMHNLQPSKSLQELYLTNFKCETLPSWVNPADLTRLKYLSIEVGDIKCLNCAAMVSDPNWRIEGLCLKNLKRLEADWNDLHRDMPSLRYLEVKDCSGLRNFPVSVLGGGVWRKTEA